MATRVTLPYVAPAELLPGPLPTVAEILATPPLPEAIGIPVARVGQHFVVKYGKESKILQEGENLLFVQQSTSVPVPRVYALFHDDKTDMNFIVQEYIPGRLLASCWGKLSTAEKQSITSQLRHHMDELRSIPSPGYYGGVWRQPIQASLFAEHGPLGMNRRPHPDSTISGPHETEEAWTDAMWRFLDTSVESNSVFVPSFIPFLRRPYQAIFKGHHPVFTHGDLQPVNIMLRDDGGVVIIDWEHAGWYPSYWEYCTSAMSNHYLDDWWQWIRESLDEYFAELGWMYTHKSMVLMEA